MENYQRASPRLRLPEFSGLLVQAFHKLEALQTCSAALSSFGSAAVIKPNSSQRRDAAATLRCLR